MTVFLRTCYLQNTLLLCTFTGIIFIMEEFIKQHKIYSGLFTRIANKLRNLLESTETDIAELEAHGELLQEKINNVKITDEGIYTHMLTDDAAEDELLEEAENDNEEEENEFEEDMDQDDDEFQLQNVKKIRAPRNFHCMWIKDLGKLVRSQLTSSAKHKAVLCNRCLNHFKTQDTVDKHLEYCTTLNDLRIKTPKPQITFKNFAITDMPGRCHLSSMQIWSPF